jgi:hypothetical protein
MPQQVTIAARFAGPTGSANGGYTCGLVAERLLAGLDPAGAVTVTLRTPPPLERPMDWRDAGGLLTLLAGDVTVAEAHLSTTQPREPVAPVPHKLAAAASQHYPGLIDHPFPQCFSCGPERPDSDGLAIYPGPLKDTRVAATWTPDPIWADATGTVGAPISWAALDCSGGWAAGVGGRPMVLGRMTARLLSHPLAGQQHVVVGALRTVDGRKYHASTALYRGTDLIGHADQVWLTIDPAGFN